MINCVCFFLNSFKYDDMSFTELLQKYMKELETRHDGKQQPSLPDKSLAEVQTTTKEIALKSEPDKEKENLMRKELDKAYERISSLEVPWLTFDSDTMH